MSEATTETTELKKKKHCIATNHDQEAATSAVE